MPSEADPEPAKSTEVERLQPVPQADTARRSGAFAALVAASLVVVVAAIGGGYMLWHRSRPAPPQSNPSQSAASPVAVKDWAVAGADSNPTATQVTSSATEKKPSAGVAATSAPSQVATPATAQAAVSAPRPQPPPVAFNPKKLDPKKNTRLKFDLGHFPAGLAFTVEMDGKTFFKGHAASKADYDGLFVPPGVHELRIEAGAGAVQKASNTVTAHFIAKKHMTLKVELRPLPSRKPATANLDPASQIVASIKTDFFSF